MKRTRVLAVLVAAWGAGGCVPPKTAEEAQAERRAGYERANEERDTYRAASLQRGAAKRAENNQRLDAAEAARTSAREQKHTAIERAKEEALEADCARDRDLRRAEEDKREASFDARDEVRAWNNAHCKQVDNSKRVVRVLQDSRGEYHTVEGRDRGVDTVCDAPRPSALQQKRPLYEIPSDLARRIRQCSEADERAEEK